MTFNTHRLNNIKFKNNDIAILYLKEAETSQLWLVIPGLLSQSLASRVCMLVN